MNFDELRTRYLEDVATPEGRAATILFESAIVHARGISGSGFPPTGRERRAVFNPSVQFADEIERLVAWAPAHGIDVTYAVGDGNPPHDTNGTEHLVWFEDTTVRKLTFESPDSLSQGPFAQTLEAFDQVDLDDTMVTLIENRKASPSEYLERLYLQNILFQVDNILTSVSAWGIESTQPFFAGEAVKTNAYVEFFTELGFEQKSRLTWHSSDLDISISDVATHNLIRVGEAIVPFDIWAKRLRI